jgi:putative lipoic acid-binding regulatory protein
MSDESPLTFPCEFPIKAMGRAHGRFEETVRAIIRSHAGELDQNTVRVAESRNGRFVSVTVTITASSRAQLDAIYADLQAHDDVLATL